jgi:hypothetical protein
MLIGTSLGQCVPSILRGEVELKDVVLIITRTLAQDYEAFLRVLNMYYSDPSIGYGRTSGYSFADIEWRDVEDLAYELWHSGRIHQPRNFGGTSFLPQHELWIELAPTNYNSNPSVVAAYDAYKTLRDLTK